MDQCWFKKPSPNEEALLHLGNGLRQNCMIIDHRDWPVSTVGITGLRENFSRDRGIEEPF